MQRRRFLTAPLLVLPPAAMRVRGANAPVVLELFTSQGCSSCPPADAFLGELVHRPGIIGLAWHVDYWNSLGWRDQFARPEWTDRQRAYAKHLGGDVFTPALVVNGAAMMVGSDKAAVRRAIDDATPPPITISFRRTASGAEAEIGTIPMPATALLVIYDPEQATQVDAGENRGRQLVEYRVVREVVQLDSARSRLNVPTIPERRGAVLLLQDASWRIIGAADLPPDQTA